MSVARPALLVLLLVAATGCGPETAGAEPGPAAPVAPSATPRGPNVLVWMVDTLRADRLGCYGAERATSPHYDALAARGVLFEQAFAASNWTQPSVLSLLSGTWPLPFPDGFTGRVPAELVMGPEWFWGHGWQTAGFTVTAAVAGLFGFDQGFETWAELDEGLDAMARKRREGQRFSAARLVDAALVWLDEAHDPRKPFLLYLHGVEPHMPYEAHAGGDFCDPAYAGEVDGSIDALQRLQAEGREPDESGRRFLRDRYDGEVLESDRHFGALVEGLRARGLLEDTLLVLVADHGDEHWEHGAFGHGHRNLHRELLHVPVVLAWPAGLPAGVRVGGPLRAVDLMPTLAELCGLPALPGAEGASVAAVARAGGVLPEQPLFADRASEDEDLRAVRTERWLFTFGPRPKDTALYDLREDPGATRDVLAGRHDEARPLLELLQGWADGQKERRAFLGVRGSVTPGGAELEALRALGYVK